MPEAFRWRAEPRPRDTLDGVAAPAQVADDQVAVGETADQPGLEVAVRAVALDERVADQQDAVAVGRVPHLGRAGDRGEQSRGHKENDVAKFHRVLVAESSLLAPGEEFRSRSERN